MEAIYKRNLSQSYMLLEPEEEAGENHELKMLSYHSVPGMLPVKPELYDGRTRYWYEITGKQSLEDFLKRRGAGDDLLRRLFLSLETVCREIPNYMLEENRLLLRLEYIYLDFAGESIYFTYVPGITGDLNREFRDLMEVLLQKLDHSDPKAVAAGYGMYQLTLQSGISIRDMLDEVLQTESAEENASAQEKRQEKLTAENGCSDTDTEINRPEKMVEDEESPGWKEIIGRLFRWKDSKTASLLQSNWFPFREKYKRRKLSERTEDYGKAIEAQEEEESPHPTEYLSGREKGIGRLVYQGSGRMPDFNLDRTVFLIGKKRSEVDGYIDQSSVSRIHAELEKEDDGYYIIDMNSTNGTFVNGEQLEYRQKIKLEPRDRISFGEVEYIFL